MIPFTPLFIPVALYSRPHFITHTHAPRPTADRPQSGAGIAPRTGPNSCGSPQSSTSCSLQEGICSTGQAGGSTDVIYSYFCLDDLPTNGKPNGAGAFCYPTAADCLRGPNACNASVPCAPDRNCITGVASGAAGGFMCPLDVPTGALPIGSGQYCYSSAANCTRG